MICSLLDCLTRSRTFAFRQGNVFDSMWQLKRFLSISISLTLAPAPNCHCRRNCESRWMPHKKKRCDSSRCSVRLKLSVVWTKSIRRFNRPNQVVKANKTIGNSLRNGQIIRLSSWLLCVLAHSLHSARACEDNNDIECFAQSIVHSYSQVLAHQMLNNEVRRVTSTQSVLWQTNCLLGVRWAHFHLAREAMRHCMLYDEIIESKNENSETKFRSLDSIFVRCHANPVRNSAKCDMLKSFSRSEFSDIIKIMALVCEKQILAEKMRSRQEIEEK